PRTYHITLTLEFEAKGQPARFRYQLVGPHGIPIEGEWYTSTYRNPMIGTVDAHGNLIRDLEDTQYRISSRKGGDKVPSGDLSKDNYIQYAGVANQFFASLIVPDDKQPPPDKGGVDFKR